MTSRVKKLKKVPRMRAICNSGCGLLPNTGEAGKLAHTHRLYTRHSTDVVRAERVE
jgi:hypothetical protein